MSVIDRIIAAAPTKRQGLAVAYTWLMIESTGWQATKNSMRKSTWYSHLRIIKAAGLSEADIRISQVVSIRRPIIMQPVSSWDELRRKI